jgi:cysteine-rich repeat protein
VDFGLTVGKVYEIVVFQAERHMTESHYKLTLSNFAATRSSCHTVCGDGIVTSDEACDLGGSNNSGAYGTCNPNCTRPAFCGDATVNGPEQCDDGVNRTSYGGTSKKCGSDCKWAPYCGDGKPDTAYSEQCDEGADNGKGYGHCTTSCTPGPRCGDGLVTDAEECDHGAQNGMPGDKCSAKCSWNCGNGTVDQGEQCDNGTAANTGGYGKCKSDCSWGPRCGDGIKNGTEQCDDGVNDNTYGACGVGCVLGPRCGDGITQTQNGETCDKGSANSPTAYGKDTCTNRCQTAPYCGNKSVDSDYGEICDDGVNSGEPGSCKPDCSAFVPLPSCGDGTVQPPEICDQGALNGTAGATCDKNCRPSCGNGVKDPGEECDDGVNDNAYGGCTPTCKRAGYCGDGIKNGNEQCDNGTANLPNPYGPGNKCTTSCTKAPYCGDGRIQSAFGEECDSTPMCDAATCKSQIIP